MNLFEIHLASASNPQVKNEEKRQLTTGREGEPMKQQHGPEAMKEPGKLDGQLWGSLSMSLSTRIYILIFHLMRYDSIIPQRV